MRFEAPGSNGLRCCTVVPGFQSEFFSLSWKNFIRILLIRLLMCSASFLLPLDSGVSQIWLNAFLWDQASIFFFWHVNASIFLLERDLIVTDLAILTVKGPYLPIIIGMPLKCAWRICHCGSLEVGQAASYAHYCNGYSFDWFTVFWNIVS